MPRIFEAYACLGTARDDGLGIGLFIVRRAIEILDIASRSPAHLHWGYDFPSLHRKRGSKRDLAKPVIPRFDAAAVRVLYGHDSVR